MTSVVTGNHSGLAKRFHQQRLATDMYMGPCRVKLWDDVPASLWTSFINWIFVPVSVGMHQHVSKNLFCSDSVFLGSVPKTQQAQ